MSSSVSRARMPVIVWPSDNRQFRLTPSEKKIIEMFVRFVWANAYSSDRICVNFDKVGNDQPVLPVSISFIYDLKGRVTDIVLLLNTTRGDRLTPGGQRAPKIAYGLSGHFWVKKQGVENEFFIIKYLRSFPSIGLPKILGERVTEIKWQYFEPLYPCTLDAWIGTSRLRGARAKLLIFHKLLTGLVHLHKLQVTQKIDDTKYTHSTFHGDIKLKNILIDDQGPVLSDFGHSNILDRVAISPLYAHPFHVILIALAPEERIHALMTHGRALDMWSLGIVFATLLVNKFASDPEFAKLSAPPLNFTLNTINKVNWSISIPKLKALTQDKIDPELQALKYHSHYFPEGSLHASLWELTISMLKVDPAQIITPEAALRHLTTLTPKNSHLTFTSLAHKCQTLIHSLFT